MGIAAGIDLRRVIDGTEEAFVVIDVEGTVRVWNPAAEQLFGWRADEVVGAHLADRIIPPRLREQHEDGLHEYLVTGTGPMLGSTLELEGIDRQGIEVPVELTIHETEDVDGERCFYAFLRDIGDRRRRERAARASAAAAWTCAEAEGGLVDLNVLAAALGRALDATISIIWVPSRRGDVIVPTGTWASNDAGRVFILESVGTALARAQGLPGETWATGEPRWSANLGDDPRFVRAKAAQELGMRSGVFIPIGSGAACQGVIELLSGEQREATEEYLRSLSEIGSRLATHVPASLE